MNRQTRSSAIIACLLLQSWVPVFGADEERRLEFIAGIAATDNVTRVPSGEQSESVAVAGAAVRLLRDGTRLDADINGEFQYLSYLRDTFDEEMIGRFDGIVGFDIAPERFRWVLQESYGQLQIDPVSSVTPENREDVNFFSTGPDIRLRFGSNAFVNLEGRYSDTYYEVTEFSGNNTSARLDVGRNISSNSSIALVGKAERFEFDDQDAYPEYDRRSAYARYTGTGARTVFEFEAGTTHVSDPLGDQDGPLLRARVERQLNTASTLTLSLESRLTDAAERFTQQREPGASGIGVGIGASAGSPEAFESRNGSLTWRYLRGRSELVMSGTWYDDEYEHSPLFNVTRTDIYLQANRQLRPTLRGGVLASWTESDYENRDFRENVTSIAASLTWNTSRTTSLALRVANTRRSVSGAETGFKENIASLLIGFTPINR